MATCSVAAAWDHTPTILATSWRRCRSSRDGIEGRVGSAMVLPRDELFAIVDSVKDPEVPVLSVVELGIVRDAVADDSGIIVTVTPTYSGCPAMREIEADIRHA